jgi:hypothetical protein
MSKLNLMVLMVAIALSQLPSQSMAQPRLSIGGVTSYGSVPCPVQGGPNFRGTSS